MIILIDAYNVIHALPSFEKSLDKSLRAARDYLIAFCRSYQASRGDVKKIILVFDGSSEVSFPSDVRQQGIQLVYTESGEDADERILEIIRSLGQEGRVTVVSNDNYVWNNARALGAKAISAGEFFKGALPKKKSPGKQPASGPMEKIPSNAADRITAEYKRILGIH